MERLDPPAFAVTMSPGDDVKTIRADGFQLPLRSGAFDDVSFTSIDPSPTVARNLERHWPARDRVAPAAVST